MGAAAAASTTKKVSNPLREKFLERHDPKKRGVDGAGGWTELIKKDPGRHYVLVSENSGHYDVEYYSNIAPGMGLDPSDGYRVERASDGVKLRAGSTSRGDDDLIRFRGMVLMSCTKEFKKLLEEFGEDGQGGQRQADTLDKMVGRRRTFEDPNSNVRGHNGTQYVRPLSQQELEQG